MLLASQKEQRYRQLVRRSLQLAFGRHRPCQHDSSKLPSHKRQKFGRNLERLVEDLAPDGFRANLAAVASFRHGIGFDEGDEAALQPFDGLGRCLDEKPPFPPQRLCRGHPAVVRF